MSEIRNHTSLSYVLQPVMIQKGTPPIIMIIFVFIFLVSAIDFSIIGDCLITEDVILLKHLPIKTT